MNIALLFARGGSKGLKSKNVKILGTKPLIAYSIEAALASEMIDIVYVSTECDEIADIARFYGAKIIARPDELATDTSDLFGAYLHAFNYLLANKIPITKLVFLMPTYPFKTGADITKVVRLLDYYGQVHWYSLRIVDPYEFYMPDTEGHFKPIELATPEYTIDVSQQEAFYILVHSVIGWQDISVSYQQELGITREKYAHFSLNIIVDHIRGLDINTAADFALAESIIATDKFDFSSCFDSTMLAMNQPLYECPVCMDKLEIQAGNQITDITQRTVGRKGNYFYCDRCRKTYFPFTDARGILEGVV